ncbi:MAG: adenosine kinase [candidate division Zixibacteria bacterium]|nr:adenosine kinase [candidate division Zixibacteria bacterium]MBU1469951.1 adenosine kinase [candidate division Zixibacteria bacterium]MBU2626063.1 adenosine kinase [candidate division Zixibacteria bacterium]
MKKYDVYGIGNALVDYLALVDDEFLAKNGIQKGLMTLVDTPGTEKRLVDIPSGFERQSGGSAANTVVGIAKLGGRSCFTGKVARDSNGQFYGDDLASAGVDFSSNPKEGITGTCVSFVTPDGERSMLTHLGVSSELTNADINEDFVANSAYVYIEGYQWSAELARNASIHAMELAKKHGTKIAFTYSDPFMAKQYRDDFNRLTTEFVDLLFCNSDEAMAITNVDSIDRAIQVLKSQTAMVCVTVGSRGAIVSEDGIITATPALAVNKLIDTTGAGDMYAAGVLRGLTAGFDLVASSMIGSRMASAIVSQVGARLP